MSHMQRSTYETAYEMIVKAVNSGADGKEIGEDLFGAADLLNANSSLLLALTDPSRTTEDKQTLVENVFRSSTSSAAFEVMSALVADHWSVPAEYSAALADLGLDAHILAAINDDKYDDLCQELIDAQALIANNRDFRVQLSDVGDGDPRARAALARRVFSGHVSKVTERLLSRAAFSTPYGQLLQTLRSYADRAAAATGKQLVVAYTAKSLTEEQYYRLARLASFRWNSAVQLATVVEPSLLGGFRLDAGDESVDTTVRRDLIAARSVLTR
ncbi:F0F1 ATP synthase subunit delta [Actinomycetaceae bacterium MB13-C1-2]|nr:F0F1 ATP synthase subunit delta [Actinomycetaceae bacterium MB13-C1-2]